MTEVSNGELPGPAAAPQDPGAGRHDAFLSYARQDRVAVDRLAAALKARGKDVWVDVEDIVGGANWRARIKRGIEACSAFVFVLSPAALRSAHCRQELDQAVELNKLIVPVYHRQVEEGDVPAALADREWIFLRDTDAFESGLAKLVEALETDLAWRDQHTRIAGRAREWLDTGRDRSYLLRGSDLREAESWLAQQADHRQGATAEQARYIVESRSNASSRQRMLLTGVGVGLVVAVALAVFALVQRNDAVRQEHVATEQKRTAQSGRLAAEAQLELNSDPSLAGVLNLEAYRLQPTLEARSAALTTVARLGRAQGALRGHSQGVFAVAFSPDGKTLVSAGNDSTLRLWDVAHREALGRPINPRYITHAAVSPDFKTLVTTDDRTVRFWDRAGRELGASLDGYHVNAMAFSPDGKLLATAGEDPGGDGLVQLWDVARRQPAGALFVGHWQAVNSVAFSPDGRTLATGGDDRDVRLWDVAGHRALASPLTSCWEVIHHVGRPLCGHRGPVTDVAFSPDGALLASASEDKTVRLWDVAQRRPSGAPLTGHKGQVRSLAFSPDGTVLASGGEDSTVRLWDVAHRRLLTAPLTGHEASIEDVAFSPDGTMLASAGDTTVRLWDAAPDTPLSTILQHHTEAAAVAFSPDGTTVAVAGGPPQPAEPSKTKHTASAVDEYAIQLFGAGDRRALGRPLIGHRDWVNRLAFSPDGTVLASASGDGTARLWDVANHQALGRPIAHPDVAGLAFSPDGRTLATVGDQTARLWNVADQRERGGSFTHEYGAHEVAFSPDGKLLATAGEDTAESGSLDHVVRLWDVASHRPLDPPLRGHRDWIDDLAFSPDGRLLATASWDKTVRLWDVARRQPVGDALLGHSAEVVSVAFSPDGATLASASWDRTVRLWDVRQRHLLGLPLAAHHGHVNQVAFSPDGRTLVSASTDTTVRLWSSILWSDDFQALQRHVCQHVRRSLSSAQWRALLPGEPYRDTCPP